MPVHHLICFGSAPGNGNPALVVEGDTGDAAARQAFARARGATCAFIDESEDGALRIDYVYPHMRSPLCLHATLAAAAVLFARPAHAHAAELAVHTAMRGQRLVLTRDESDYFVRLAPNLHLPSTSTTRSWRCCWRRPASSRSRARAWPRSAVPSCWSKWRTAKRCTACARTWPRSPPGAGRTA